jgi:hypothetical protein
MFDFLKRIFSSKELETKELTLKELQPWLNQKVSLLDFNTYLQEYFNRITEIKSNLKENLQVLKTQELSKDHKNVEARVKNIVFGHRTNYVRDVLQFAEKLNPLQFVFKTVDHLQQAIKFNLHLNTELDQLASRTLKSYQACNHLFYQQTEAVFKELGELNLLVKEFNKKIERDNFHRLYEIDDLITDILHITTKSDLMERQLTEVEKNITKYKKDLEQQQQLVKEIQKSEEYRQHNQLQTQESKLSNLRKSVDDEIYMFFSTLNKPLKRYERVALENKPILPYLKDALEAFWRDTELNIISSLSGLKKSLQGNHLEFSDKQKKNFVDLIQKAEKGYLKELREKGRKFDLEIKSIRGSIDAASIAKSLTDAQEMIKTIFKKIEQKEKDQLDLKDKIRLNTFEKTKEKLVDLIRDIFQTKITFS